MPGDDLDSNEPSTLEPFVSWLDRYGDDRFAGLADQLCADIPELSGDPDTHDSLRDAIVSHLPVLRSVLAGDEENDEMLSFYSKTPSGFQVEYGYGGKLIDDSVWTPAVAVDRDPLVDAGGLTRRPPPGRPRR
ncbi:hypothetical protein ACFWPQ_44195 [Streptomyces sp. NPDC058464]|uniref:hypothetical protein n=1 Tax=Streptomyces sp. NPDC058464 TaxID=3346511 RepID=UPI00365B3551